MFEQSSHSVRLCQGRSWVLQTKVNVMFRRYLKGLLAVSLIISWIGLAAGCADESTVTTKEKPFSVKPDIGGFVFYDIDNDGAYDPTTDVALQSVTVTLTVQDGTNTKQTTTSNSLGVWSIANVDTGSYVISFALTGYESISAGFNVSSQNAGNVSNDFIDVPDVNLEETGLVATIGAPLSLDLNHGDSLQNGVDGLSASYGILADTSVIVTFSQAIVDLITDDINCDNLVGGGNLTNGTLDATNTILTFSESDINSCLDGDGDGSPDTMDTDTFTNAQLTISADWITPINGSLKTFTADILFDVVN